ncbi:MAG: SPFH domain-containing protein [Bacteroidaceae bacterium]|nr:SPFH domain-containing protein [Bacteroidaceae bacterium]MBQ3237533.1 SPFH domain-containing protein [Bacteroidaceae bacterium]MBQ3238415.1 SPFH domain-containing protein [Bacteroidaceae bacterium]MBR3984098.1 SPFH domain-containing protein [Bacteroidaceae bacterium]MBR4040769.1 SPFH domain-containing protein [Bacteroidaceae bacterium]
MMKNLVKCALVAGMMCGITSCVNVAPGAGEEAVLIHQPYLFGHGGVDDEPVETGRQYEWFSTKYVIVSMLPQKFDEKLDDAASNDNTLLDFSTQIQLQVKDNKSPVLIKNYGPNWYVNVIQEVYRNTVRNYISKFGPFDLMSNREVLDSINYAVKNDMEDYIADLSEKGGELPVTVVNVVVGRAIPNEKQKAEMDNTAAATQAKRTEESRLEMLKAKEAAERQRAIADKAYQKELGLSTDQFIQLKAWEIIEKKDGANIDVLVGNTGTANMWNVRR